MLTGAGSGSPRGKPAEQPQPPRLCSPLDLGPGTTSVHRNRALLLPAGCSRRGRWRPSPLLSLLRAPWAPSPGSKWERGPTLARACPLLFRIPVAGLLSDTTQTPPCHNLSPLFFLAKFKLISQAYEVLSDPKKRDIYDQGGEQAIKEGGSGSPSFSSPMDIFDMFFGGGGRMARERRGKNVVHQLSVTLEDLYNGVTKKLALQKNVICEKCEGVGGKKGSVEKCPLCKGRGMQIHIQQIGPGMVQQIQTVCIECKGQGERINPKDRCESCSGARVTREKKIIEVHVERGMKDGQKILFHGEGDQEPELEPGDVIIVLDQKDHSVFQRRGHDLIMKMKIQLSEALCGFKKTIKTLDDRTLVITSKSGIFLFPTFHTKNVHFPHVSSCGQILGIGGEGQSPGIHRSCMDPPPAGIPFQPQRAGANSVMGDSSLPSGTRSAHQCCHNTHPAFFYFSYFFDRQS
uniref:DnaJ heat shock protein family (Hsp40) member A4 n=1 Tax=Oryctolagus cuniculus TaxID=9986 RepID=A0A5F9CH38_RABIT